MTYKQAFLIAAVLVALPFAVNRWLGLRLDARLRVRNGRVSKPAQGAR